MAARAQTGPGFSRAAAWSLLGQACRYVGLDPDGSQLLRLGENAIFALRASSTIVRIGRGMDHWDDAVKEVSFSRWLATQGLRVVRAEPWTQPIDIEGHPVTFWEYLAGRPGGPEDIRELGAVLRELHQLERPSSFELPDTDPLGRVQRRIELAQVPPDDQEFLQDRLTSLARELPRLDFPLSSSVVHGDAHVENLIVDADGVVLIDFERAGWGQPEWDLSLTATEYLSAQFYTEDQYIAFVDSYGFDVTSWSGFYLLRQTHELKMTSWLMQNVKESSKIQEEYELRMRVIRGAEPDRPWTPF